MTLLGIALNYFCDKYEYIALRNDRVPFWNSDHLNFERLKFLSKGLRFENKFYTEKSSFQTIVTLFNDNQIIRKRFRPWNF